MLSNYLENDKYKENQFLVFFVRSPIFPRRIIIGRDKTTAHNGKNERIRQFLKWFDLFYESIHILCLSHSLYQAQNLKTVARRACIVENRMGNCCVIDFSAMDLLRKERGERKLKSLRFVHSRCMFNGFCISGW